MSNIEALVSVLLLLFKKIGSARLRESDIYLISPKTPAPQYQPIDSKKRKRIRVEDYSRDREAQANKKALALLLKPASPTPSNTLLGRSFQRDTDRGMKVLRGSAARRCISVPMCDQSTACNPHWHIWSRQSNIKRVHRVTPDIIKHTGLPRIDDEQCHT